MKDYKEIFDQRKNDSRYNTSYPLSPADWAQFRTQGALPFPDEDISFYIHIPFCEHLCAFCEYTRTVCPDELVQESYLKALDADVSSFMSSNCRKHRLRGFDIGGGTPTCMSDRCFWQLMQVFKETCDWMDLSDDFEPSIEGTFQTLTETKLRLFADSGIRRLSVGMQSSDETVLRCGGRKNLSLKDCMEKRQLIRDCGIEKLNIDLMYGLKGQTMENCRRDLEWIRSLDPEQVTLYEFRPNMSKGGADLSKEEIFGLYKILYDGITDMGYKGALGSNTFSKDEKDKGLSSYLRSRMFEGVAYKGFGLSAQSMSSEGVSYNLGKGMKRLDGILSSASFPEEFTYLLPKEEVFAKFVAIAAYGGSIFKDVASSILGCDLMVDRLDVIRWLEGEEMISITGNTIRITEKGFKYYGTVFSMIGQPR